MKEFDPLWKNAEGNLATLQCKTKKQGEATKAYKQKVKENSHQIPSGITSLMSAVSILSLNSGFNGFCSTTATMPTKKLLEDISHATVPKIK